MSLRSVIARIPAAGRLLLRGSIAPFNQVPPADSTSGDGALKSPYRQSVWVHAATRHVARPIAAVGLEHGSAPRGSSDSAEIEDPRIEAFWASPAVGIQSFAEFVLASVGWRKLAGECFWILGDDAILPFPEVRTTFPRMILARPDRMRHVAQDGVIVAWEYRDGSGRAHALGPDQVIHVRQWNPYDDHRGLGDLESAMLAAEGDVAAARFSRNLSLSNGDQGPYVIGKNGVVDEAQRRQIIAALRQKRELQARGTFAAAFLTGDITVQDPLIRAVDAAFLEARRMSAEEIFVAFGVPPSMSKTAASYSIGSASDYYRLILDTCIPEATELAQAISAVSSRLLGRQVWSWFCWDEHPVLQEVRKERMDTATKLWDRGVPMRQVSDYLDLGIPEYDGDRVGYLPATLVPSDMAADPIPASAADEPALTGGSKPDPSADSAVEMAIHALRQRGGGSAAARLWARHMRARAGSVRAYRSAFTRVLTRARAAVLAKLEAGGAGIAQGPSGGKSATVTAPGKENASQADAVRCGKPSKGANQKSGAIDLAIEEEEFGASLKIAFRSVHASALKTAIDQLAKELGRDDPLQFPPARAIQFIAERENRLSDVPASVFDDIRKAISDGMEAGDGITGIADRVRAQFNDLGRERALRIAMTETAAAYGTARQEGMTQAGVAFKEWVTSGADNVRPAHADAQGQTVRADEPFTVGGESLMHPGDPSGSPGNVINCHCVAVAVAKPDDQ